MITVTCSCGKTYHVKDSYAGKKAKCTCGKVLKISDPPQILEKDPKLEEKDAEKITFSCECGKNFDVSKKYIGKKVRCKACQKILRVPDPSAQEDTQDEKTSEYSSEVEISTEEFDSDEEFSSESIGKEDKSIDSASPEKPRRLLFICLGMLLIGAIAYGAFMYFSKKTTDALPEKQQQTVVPEKLTTKPEKSGEPEESAQEKDTTEGVKEESEPIDEQTTSESAPESLTALKNNIEDQEEKVQLEETAQKKTEKLNESVKEIKITSEPEIKEKTQVKEKIEKISQPPIQPKPKPKPKPKPVPKPVPKPDPKPVPKPVSTPPKEKITVASVDKKVPPPEEKALFRSHSMTYTRKQVLQMIQKYNFYDAEHNPNGGFPNRFVDNRNGTITDNETKLMWQKSGSREMMSWSKIPGFIDRLNNRKFAGYSDWRLPTLEELLSLTEPRHSRQGLYISSFFSQKQGIVGTSDSCTFDGKKIPWYTSFLRGISNCVSYDLIDEFHVRAVRSMIKTGTQN